MPHGGADRDGPEVGWGHVYRQGPEAGPGKLRKGTQGCSGGAGEDGSCQEDLVWVKVVLAVLDAESRSSSDGDSGK